MNCPTQVPSAGPKSDWLVGGDNQTGNLIRSMDWSKTPLGPRDAWPQCLRTITNLVLASSFPMAILWGSDLILLYNDAYRVDAADKHPHALGRSVREVWPEIADFHRPIEEKVMGRGQTVHLEDQLFRVSRHGSLENLEDVYFTLSYGPIFTETGQIGGMLITLLETTHRKLAEDAVLASEHKLKSILDTMGEGVALNEIIYNEQGEMVDYRILQVNPAFYEIADFEPGQVVGNVATKLYGMSSESIKEFWKQHRHAAQTMHSEMVSPKSRKTYFISTSPFHNDRFVTSFVDITECKQVEESLRKSEERLRLGSQVAGLGTFAYDFASGTGSWSPELKALCGLQADEPLLLDDDKLPVFLHPEDRSAYLARFTASLDPRSDGRFEMDHRILWPDGSIRWMYVSGLTSFIGEGDQRRPWHAVGAVADITQRKAAEENLRYQSALLEAQANSAIDGIMIADSRGKKVFQNQRTIELWKIPPHVAADCDAEAQFQYVLSMIKHPGQISAQVHHLNDHPNEISRHEVELVDGTVLDVYSAPVLGKDGHRYGRIWVFRDISDRKRTEKTLQESEARFRDITHSMGDWVWEVDRNGVYTYSSEAGSAILGTGRGEILGKTPFDFMPPEEARRVAPIFSQIQARKAPIKDLENWILRGDGQQICLLTNAVPILDEAGNLKGYRGVDKDITARKQAERALRESEMQYRTLANSGQALIWTAGLDKKCDYFNQPWLDFTGRTLQQELGDGWAEGVHPDDLARCFEIYTTAFERRARFSMVYRIRHHSGMYRWLQDDGSPRYDSQGNFLGYIGHCLDITERKLLEEQLRQVQKLESVGRLAGGVAHDFNNMLTVILGRAELALKQSDLDRPQRDCLEEIRHAANRSADLTRKLLTFARKQTIRPQVLDLNQAVSGMLSMLQRLIGENIQILWQPTANLWPVKIDPSQVDQALANLCVNSRDAIADRGSIKIETANITFDENYCGHHPGFASPPPPGDYVRLSVSDDGCGMDDETQSHVFEPFFTTKPVGQGTGLGLAVVFGIVEQNQGYVHFASTPGTGTIFSIFWPRQRGGGDPVRAAAAPKSAVVEGTTILLVEDEPSVLESLQLILKVARYRVLAAGSPGEALRLARAHAGAIHLLLTDMIMPEMNGRELAHELLSLRPGLKCVFMSGYQDDILGAHGVLDGKIHFLPKPASPEDLFAKLREALASP